MRPLDWLPVGLAGRRATPNPSPNPYPDPHPHLHPNPNPNQVESTLARFVAVEEEVGPEHVEASSSSSSPPPQQQQQQHAPVIVAPQCCWSTWGDEAACGGYPTSSGGACNTEWTKACIADGDCPTPTVAPAVLMPPGQPTAGPDRPSLPTAALRETHRELAES